MHHREVGLCERENRIKRENFIEADRKKRWEEKRMGYIKKLEGKHLYLAVPKVEDAATYVKWLSDFDTTDGLGNLR